MKIALEAWAQRSCLVCSRPVMRSGRGIAPARRPMVSPESSISIALPMHSYLASDDAGWVTGEFILGSGGMR